MLKRALGSCFNECERGRYRFADKATAFQTNPCLHYRVTSSLPRGLCESNAPKFRCRPLGEPSACIVTKMFAVTPDDFDLDRDQPLDRSWWWLSRQKQRQSYAASSWIHLMSVIKKLTDSHSDVLALRGAFGFDEMLALRFKRIADKSSVELMPLQITALTAQPVLVISHKSCLDLLRASGLGSCLNLVIELTTCW